MPRITEDEARWTFNRMKELKAQGVGKVAMKVIVAREAKRKPWL